MYPFFTSSESSGQIEISVANWYFNGKRRRCYRIKETYGRGLPNVGHEGRAVMMVRCYLLIDHAWYYFKRCVLHLRQVYVRKDLSYCGIYCSCVGTAQKTYLFSSNKNIRWERSALTHYLCLTLPFRIVFDGLSVYVSISLNLPVPLHIITTYVLLLSYNSKDWAAPTSWALIIFNSLTNRFLSIFFFRMCPPTILLSDKTLSHPFYFLNRWGTRLHIYNGGAMNPCGRNLSGQPPLAVFQRNFFSTSSSVTDQSSKLLKFALYCKLQMIF